MKKVLIIGANGFIGTHLSRHIASNYDISLTVFSRTISENLAQLGKNKNVSIVQGDFNDILKLVPLVKDQDIVYHLVSASFPSSSWVQPDMDINKNLIPTINLLRLCSDLNVKKVVFISSGGTVYGKQVGPVTEESAIRPFSPYGIIKLAIENFLEYYRIKNNLNYDIYRLSNPYGPGQDKIGFGVINTWLKSIYNNKEIHVFGDGSSSKDYIYIDDAIKLISLSLESDLNKSEVYNACSGTVTSLNNIINIIRNVVKKHFDVQYDPSVISDNTFVQLDNSKILNRLPGFKFTSISEGIEKTWESINSNQLVS